ncbi:GntR family transcriptional regulator [Conexibacter sp. CPCC 206217]|uniref:GntR family transcriptional regulator n=1 Tax=Conexibacter sp. CPCC 206217 TaxID=3064574 RepID=UPI00272310EF|nr:GntR family transcriptional regulator [Conexibacter sp. CPCC 206217]MDO8211734.1 GntR family transcriptional regulator [Conexibacter sp. CPCC 206217]
MSKQSEADDALLAAIEPVAAEAAAAGAGYEPLGNAIARHVREAILSGRLAPGTRVRQEALARRFGVSRIPVREALRQLESQGLVVLVPHSGARVARLDLAEHLELYRIREALEPIAIAESAPRLSDEQLAELHRLQQEISAAVDDEPRWLELDRRFHLGSYAAAEMPRLLALIDDLWNTTQHYRRAYRTMLATADFDFVDLDHRYILDALDRRDPVDAEQRIRSHIRRTRVLLDAHHELFDQQ